MKQEQICLEFPYFFYDPEGVDNLLSDSSAFSKSNLYIWNFSIHTLLKSSLKNLLEYAMSAIV